MNISLCKTMVKENNFCVLSTCKDLRTNSSLMLYMTDEDAQKLYMVTLKGSTKYASIVENPEVSLLIDTREKITERQPQVKALTVYGHASIIKDRDWSLEIIEKLVRKHPSLRALTEMDDSCIVQVDITNFLYLDGVSDARYVSLSDD
ncbi:pyridoxamine 5'-phosphate oxidase family protein [Proteiniclasticum sp. C24MP]|uniref:pyridoxamine 5'-phosphate oxidase family protein n=1 Tax=Proteiniclasticum sp. C24MP TaxID=3374101 RepID=UPI003753EDD6